MDKKFKHKVVIPRDEWGCVGDDGLVTPIRSYAHPDADPKGCVLVHILGVVAGGRQFNTYLEVDDFMRWSPFTAREFYSRNDDEDIPKQERERQLIALAAQHSIDLSFIPTRDYKEDPSKPCALNPQKTDTESCTNSPSEQHTVTS